VKTNYCDGGSVTENDYGGDARNRKWLRWRIVGPWWLVNDPLLIALNDMSDENT